MFQTKEFVDVPVAYVNGFGNPAMVAAGAFQKLERIVPLRGNKFYGVFYPDRGEYWACVAIPEDGAIPAGLQRGDVPGGLYAYTTIRGPYLEIVRKIKPALDQMRDSYQYDSGRPSVEFYKRHTEVLVMLPIVG